MFIPESERLKKEKGELVDEVERLKSTKKISEEEIKHLVKIDREKREIEFTKKEMENVARNLDQKDLNQEIIRVAKRMEAVGQDPKAAEDFILFRGTKVVSVTAVAAIDKPVQAPVGFSSLIV